MGDDEAVPALEEEFDFDAHERRAIESYQREIGLFDAFAKVTKGILTQALAQRTITIHSIEARAKSIVSFASKARTPSADNENAPKYANPIDEITDLAGVRVITFFTRTLDEVDELVKREFDVVERSDKADLLEVDRLGYQSIHYLVRLKDSRTELPEYAPHKGRVAEVQVRTILQHAWAEIQHDVQYKAVHTLPVGLGRRFAALAGLLELADREFQAIEDDRRRFVAESTKAIESGHFDDIDITPESLKSYLDRRFGLDLRYGPQSYQLLASTVHHLGFRTISQIDECMSPFNDNYIEWVSRYLRGRRQGQIQRFEDLLKIALGYNYLARHPLREEFDFNWRATRDLERLSSPASGQSIGFYDPLASPPWTAERPTS